MRKLYFSFVLVLLMLTSAFAKNTLADNKLNFYEAPDVKAKVISTLEAGNQLIPIFYPEKGDWIKMADPKNGNVGWVKVDDLKGPFVISKKNGMTIRQQIFLDKNKKPQVYRVIEYSGDESQQLKPEESEKIFKGMEERQKRMQQEMQKMQESMDRMIQDMMRY